MSYHGYGSHAGFSGSASPSYAAAAAATPSGPEYEKEQRTKLLEKARRAGDHLAAANLALANAEVCRGQKTSAFGARNENLERDAFLLEQGAWSDAASALKEGKREGALAVLGRIAEAQRRRGNWRSAGLLEKTMAEWKKGQC